MEFLNGGDLMYHIQDKGRFELYRATYSWACAGEGGMPGPSYLPGEAIQARAGTEETGAALGLCTMQEVPVLSGH